MGHARMAHTAVTANLDLARPAA